MRAALIAALIATPAIAEDVDLLSKPCLAVLGPAIYGPETYGNGVVMGIALGYAIAHGASIHDNADIGAAVASACRDNADLTFGEALETLNPRSR